MRRFSLLALCVVVFASLALGLGSPPSGAQDSGACADGTTLAADGTCISDAVSDNVITTTSCTVGVLSADGQSCVVPRLDAPTPAPAPAAAAPASGGAIAAPVPNFTG